jgi:hypothetical protein
MLDSLSKWAKYYSQNEPISTAKQKPKIQTSLEFDTDQELALKSDLDIINLVELIAALDELCAFGKDITRKDLWLLFSNFFNVDLSAAENALSQMKHRKIEPAIFAEKLRMAVVSIVDKSLERRKNL